MGAVSVIRATLLVDFPSRPYAVDYLKCGLGKRREFAASGT